MHFLPNSTRRFTDEWSCCSSCKQEDHCILRRRIYIRSMLSRASRYTSPKVAASARAGKRHRYSDRACPRSIGAGRPRDHPSVCLTCLREYSGRVTEKYLSDPCFRCNPCFRYRPVCRHPQYCTQRKYKRIKFHDYVIIRYINWSKINISCATFLKTLLAHTKQNVGR